MDQEYIPDAKDLRILNVIADNGRFNYSQISRKTKISKDRVRERINRLIKEDFILSFFPLINYEELGYCRFKVYLKFNNLQFVNSNLKKLSKLRNIFSITKLAGEYDYEIEMIAKNKEELISDLTKIKIYPSKSLDFKIVPFKLFYYSMELDKSPNEKKIYLSQKKINIDKLDLKILKKLSDDSTQKLTEINSSLNSSEDVIRYRLKNMLKNGLIIKFYSRTNKHRLKLSTYIVLINLKSYSDKILEFILSMENVYYVSVGSDNTLIIKFYSKKASHLIETIQSITNKFGKEILDFKTLILLERSYFNPFPNKIVEDFNKKFK